MSGNDDVSVASGVLVATPAMYEHGQRERQRQRRIDRKRKRQRTINIVDLNTTGTASNVIELLDDDDGDVVIDLVSKPAPYASPIQDGEVQVLEVLPNEKSNEQRKPPPVASLAAPPVTEAHSHVLRVLEIFPDADVDYVQKKLREQKNNFEIVVAVLSENENYPRQKKGTGDGTFGAAANGTIHGNNTIIRGMKTLEPKYDYSSPVTSFEISSEYRSEVVSLLMYDFSFLKKNAVKDLMRKNQERYTLTRNHIHDIIVGKSPNNSLPVAAAAGSQAAAEMEEEENKQYQLLRAILIRGALPKDAKQRVDKSYRMQKPRKKIGVALPAITDPVLRDEHFHFERRFQEWLQSIQKRMRGRAANKLALENGSAVQCCCCFDDVALSECIPCKEKGHLFCKECIVQYVESQVFGSGNLGIDKDSKKPAMEIKCCEGSGCNSGFRDELLGKVLPQKTWEKYSEMQAKAQIDRAGLTGDLAMCPKCGYQAEVPEMQNIFECPVEGCHFISCRKCGKAAHIPLRCEEVVQKNRQDEGRLKIEEALTEAKIRTCPKCNQKFIKHDGCNKMTCACGMKMCYVCRKPLDKLKGNVYSHFCQVPHCDHSTCGKCKLYTNDAEDDAQAMREAGIAAKESYETKLRNENGGEIADLQLDVDEIMRDPSRPDVERMTQQRQGRLIRPQLHQRQIPILHRRPNRHPDAHRGGRGPRAGR